MGLHPMVVRIFAPTRGSLGQPSVLNPCMKTEFRIELAEGVGVTNGNLASAAIVCGIWTAIIGSKSSVGRRSVHIVSGSVEGRLIRTMMREVKKVEFVEETKVSSRLEMSNTSETKCLEYWLDITAP